MPAIIQITNLTPLHQNRKVMDNLSLATEEGNTQVIHVVDTFLGKPVLDENR